MYEKCNKRIQETTLGIDPINPVDHTSVDGAVLISITKIKVSNHSNLQLLCFFFLRLCNGREKGEYQHTQKKDREGIPSN